ncbi:MAG: hypothetical protein LBR33_03915 [Propionibacteriaceae bacterium]|jgi:hypothetical protein|nr:hypothetical protein [Propionibacteriaceae bacterium]
MTTTFPLDNSLEGSVFALRRSTSAQARRTVRRLVDAGVSLRRIAALTRLSRSTVGRLAQATAAEPETDPAVTAWMTTPNEDIPDGEVWKYYSTSILYDTFFETGGNLLGRYIALRASAATEEERQLWSSLIREVRQTREAVDIDDRAAMIRLVEEWRAELRDLRRL